MATVSICGLVDRLERLLCLWFLLVWGYWLCHFLRGTHVLIIYISRERFGGDLGWLRRLFFNFIDDVRWSLGFRFSDWDLGLICSWRVSLWSFNFRLLIHYRFRREVFLRNWLGLWWFRGHSGALNCLNRWRFRFLSLNSYCCWSFFNLCLHLALIQVRVQPLVKTAQRLVFNTQRVNL